MYVGVRVCAHLKKKTKLPISLLLFFFFCSLYVGAFATPVLRRKKGLYCVHATRGTGKAAKKKFELLKKKKNDWVSAVQGVIQKKELYCFAIIFFKYVVVALS